MRALLSATGPQITGIFVPSYNPPVPRSFLEKWLPKKKADNTSTKLVPPVPDQSPGTPETRVPQKTALFAFVDLKDPFTPSDIAGEVLPGPILSMMAAKRFDVLFLFHTPDTRTRASLTLSAVSERFPLSWIGLRELPVSDPKDYSSIMTRLAREVRDCVAMSGSEDNYVCVSSGTAEMRAAWFLLTAIGFLSAKLLQVGTPHRPLFGESSVKEVVNTRDWQTVRDLLMPRMFLELQHRPWALSRRELPRLSSRKDAVMPGGVPNDELLDVLFGNEEPVFSRELEKTLRELEIFVGSSALRYVAERSAIAAASHLPVLLQGETGTGKDKFANLIHRLSPRFSQEMIVVNCAAMPKELAESHLFGHVKGAFTGAVSEKKGVFEVADQGTLFLDEIAELPLELQAKLLRAIQDGSFQRVGCTKARKVDVRIIAATNRDLQSEMAAGRFRQDLYFRLEVVQVKLPPLRDRRGEIPELAHALLHKINQRRFRPKQLSKDALLRLERHPWPGNVRELNNVLERSVLYTSADVIGADDLLITDEPRSDDPLAALPQPHEGFSIDQYLTQVRKQLFLRALATSEGNQAQAALLLGVSKQAVNKFVNGQTDNLG